MSAERRDIDLETAARFDVRKRVVPFGENVFVELLHDRIGPRAVNAAPRMVHAQRRSEMIEQRHVSS
jgi:hypothetical protein